MAATEISISFEGNRLQCRPDTTVAVALWERGIRVLSHSPKYGRARGLHCAAGLCSSCLMRIDGLPNVPACLTPVRAGMRIERQDKGPRLRRPLQRLLDMGGSLFPAGFYFKWFTRPAALSRFFLKRLRPMTGSGSLPRAKPGPGDAPHRADRADQPRPHHETASEAEPFDSLIVGAGLSGLRAARDAAGRVLLIDDHTELGGQRWAALRTIRAELGPSCGGLQILRSAHEALRRAIDALPESENLDVSLQCRAVAGYHPDQLLLRDRRGLRIVRGRSLCWTAGAFDRVGLFTGNDLPGLFGPRAIYRLIARDGMDVRRRQILVAGDGLDAWLAAALLHARGAHVSLVLSANGQTRESRAAIDLHWKLHTGFDLLSIRPQTGTRLKMSFAKRQNDPPPMDLACDLAVIVRSGKPVYDIPYQMGAELVLDPARGGYVPRQWDGQRAVDRLPGGMDLEVSGEAVGLTAAEVLAGSSHEETVP